MPDDWTSIEVGLVLQGGGALGAYEWGAIEALFDLMDRLEKNKPTSLKVVTGVSIGAVNGACIVGAKDRADGLARLRKALGHPANIYAVRSAPRLSAVRTGLFVGARHLAVRAAWVLCAAHGPLEFLALDQPLQHQDAGGHAHGIAFRSSASTTPRRPSSSQRSTSRAACCGASAIRTGRLRPRPIGWKNVIAGSCSSRSTSWRAAASRRSFRGRRSASATIGMAVSSTTRRSAMRWKPSPTARRFIVC